MDTVDPGASPPISAGVARRTGADAVGCGSVMTAESSSSVVELNDGFTETAAAVNVCPWVCSACRSCRPVATMMWSAGNGRSVDGSSTQCAAVTTAVGEITDPVQLYV